MNETPANPAGVPAPGDDPQKDESPSQPLEVDNPAKPVDNPDLPEEGDSDDPEEEPVPDAEFDQYADKNDTMDNKEEAEEPNDLSGIDKEFDDDEDNTSGE